MIIEGIKVVNPIRISERLNHRFKVSLDAPIDSVYNYVPYEKLNYFPFDANILKINIKQRNVMPRVIDNPDYFSETTPIR